LIKEVRKDAIEFEEMQFFEPKEYKINWFNTLFGLDYEDEFEVIKIDLKSAYWETAKMMGLISEKTDKLLHQYFPIDTDKIKHKKSRLVSIGSLATVKKLQLFQEGKPIHTAETRQPTRGLFFEICSTVDNFMNEIIERVNKVNNDRIVYYYWDCFFIIDNPHNEKEVVNEIRKGGYDCSVEKGILKMDAINKNIQVTTRKDCNTYPYHLQKQPNIYTPVNGYIDNVIDKMPKGKIKLFA
jgi:hypothetical protein